MCSKKGCDYNEWQFITVVAKDDVYYDGAEYDPEYLVSFTGDYEAFEASEDLTLSEPTFYEGGTKLNKAPSKVGNYVIEYTVLNKGVETVTIKDEFAILSASMTADTNLSYGHKVTAENFHITVDGEPVDSTECDFFFASLDKKKTEYGKANEFPRLAGHYSVLAIVPSTETRNGALVETEFEIKQARNGFSFVPLSLDPSALQNVDMTNRSFNAFTVLFELVKSGVVKLPVGSDTTYVKPINYGEPVFIAAFYNGKFYNPAQMGKITIKYSGTTAAGKTVSGTFIPGITLLNAGTYKFSGKITETKNVAYDTYDFENVIITQRVPKMISEPEAVDGLVANGKYQKLVTTGKLLNSKHGKVLYSYAKVGENEEEPVFSEYSSLVPTAKEAGKYLVKYKVIATENANFKNGEEVTLKVRIAKTAEEAVDPDEEETPDPEGAAVPKAKGVKAEGKKKAIKVSWKAISDADLDKVSLVEIQYSKSSDFKSGLKTKRVSKSKTSTTIKALKKGTYYVRVRNVRFNEIVTSDGLDTTKTFKVSSDWSPVRKVRVK
jgi:hypothetical protein